MGKEEIETFIFFRNLNDWELGVMERFFSKLQGQTMKEDKIVWKEDNKGVFFVRGFYLLLEIDCTTLFALKIIWNSWIPLKVGFFT